MRFYLTALSLLALSIQPAQAEKVPSPYSYLEQRIDQASGSTELDSLFDSIVRERIFIREGDNLKESKLDLNNDEKGALITLLYLKGIQNDWVTPELSNKWDTALEKNKSMFSPSSRSLASCFHSLKAFEETSSSQQRPDCNRLTSSFDPSKSFLDICTLISPIINASASNPSGTASLVAKAKGIISSRGEGLRAAESTALGETSTKPTQKCEKITETASLKPLGDFIQYVDENRSSGTDDAR